MTALDKVFYTVALPVLVLLQVKRGVWSGLKQSYHNANLEVKTYIKAMRS